MHLPQLPQLLQLLAGCTQLLGGFPQLLRECRSLPLGGAGVLLGFLQLPAQLGDLLPAAALQGCKALLGFQQLLRGFLQLLGEQGCLVLTGGQRGPLLCQLAN